MKKFFVVLFVVLFAATSAYAVDFQTSGSYYARGSWISNDSGLQVDAVDYSYYDHELDMTTKIVVDDNTKVIVNYEIHDENWNQSNTDGRAIADGSQDDNIEFKRVFSTYTFTSTGTTLDLGLMTGGVWATDFANTANGRYRVKVKQATPIGPLYGILEKRVEMGSTNTALDDSEKDDSDAYYLGLVAKAGPVTVKPLLGYLYFSDAIADQGSDGWDMFFIDLGIDGSYDVWGFESEFIWQSWSWDAAIGTPDQDVYGLYAKAWFKAGPAKIYGLIAYGSEDDGRAFSFGDDFEPLTIIANWWAFGPTAGTVSGSTWYQIGLNFAATDALSFNGALAFVDSNMDDNVFWDNADAWEFDLGGAYKISDAITYSVAFGYADIDLDAAKAGQADPDGSWRLYHKFKISF